MIAPERDRGDVAVLPMWWMACAMVAVIVRLLSTGLLEGGDGIQHYQIAHFSWQHPVLFLDHWGKPLFTLFSSPFAQLGHWGMTLFNALCFVGTCWAADGLLRKAGNLARWLFPPMLLLVPVYGSMVLAGMTEPLFALLAVIVVRALHDQRSVLAMVIVSFMPYARPEHVAFAPFAILLVAWRRQWKALPFLATGHVIYGLAGLFAFGDPLWVINGDPYTGAQNIYGSGELRHFVDHLPGSFGIPLLWILGIAVGIGIVLWFRRREDRSMLGLLGVCALLPSLAILLVHSVLWWKGWKGSLGLLRIMATFAPLVVLCALWPTVRAGAILVRSSFLQWILGLLVMSYYPVLAVKAFLLEQPIPVVAGAYERFISEVGQHVGAIKEQYGRVAYFHPHVAYAADLDPYNASGTIQGIGGTFDPSGLKDGDLLVWDAHFGPNEGGVTLDRLLNDTALQLLEVMVPEERMIVLGGQPFEAFFFTHGKDVNVARTRRTVLGANILLPTMRTRADTIACPNAGPGDRCFTATEFPLELADMPLDTAGSLFTEVIVTGSLVREGEGNAEINLVLTQETDEGKIGYWSEKLLGGAFEMHSKVPPRATGVRNKLYIWNLGGHPIRINGLRVELVRTFRNQ